MNAAIAGKLNNLGSNVLKGHFIFNREMDETALKRQFGTAPKFPRGLTMAFSTDESELEQYYQIRKQAYREVLHLSQYSGGQEPEDLESMILIVKAGTTVIGGARLTISTPQNHKKLPIEGEGFDINSVYPEIDLTKINYCEMSRLALLPEFRDGHVMKEISNTMLNYCLLQNIQLGFAGNTPLHARRFERIFNHLGYGFIVREDVNIQKEMYEQIRVVFSVADFTRDQRYISTLEQVEDASLELLPA